MERKISGPNERWNRWGIKTLRLKKMLVYFYLFIYMCIIRYRRIFQKFVVKELRQIRHKTQIVKIPNRDSLHYRLPNNRQFLCTMN
jgi:hypothetical protein